MHYGIKARAERVPFRTIGCLIAAVLACALCGCVSTPRPAPSRSFSFQNDTFAYANELVWLYRYDENGKWTTEKRVPKPNYAQHCFGVARAAQQFLNHAQFVPEQPGVDPECYRKLVRKIRNRSPRKISPPESKIIIPGYANLRQFSVEHEELLKQECGPAWHSYVQRGHWRMVFPFSRSHQAKTAENLRKVLSQDCTAVLHLVRFPKLSINHAVVAYSFTDTPTGTDFLLYDPNRPEGPAVLNYETATRTFFYPAKNYFPGGRVDAYQVYHHWAF